MQMKQGLEGMKGMPRTCVKGFRHRLITRGPPVRVGLHRLNRPDTEWVEKATSGEESDA